MKHILHMYKTFFTLYVCTCLLYVASYGQPSQLPVLNKSFKTARATTNGKVLTVSTGYVQRKWTWTGKGLVTTGLKNVKTGKEWAERKAEYTADWAYFNLTDNIDGILVSLKTQEGNDEGFTSPYLEVIAEVSYPSANASVKYQIWAYPDAPGLFTRVWFKGRMDSSFHPVIAGTDNQSDKKFRATGRVDYIPVSVKNKKRRYIGYYNDTQNRNTPQTPLYREELLINDTNDHINWANIISIEQDKEGLVMVKESHKCVNQYGDDTGEFLTGASGVSNTGTSLYPGDLDPQQYKWSWASWTILYEGGDDYRELAVKQFDRFRFPANRERDMYTMVCTWGSGTTSRESRNYATEQEVSREMRLTDDLGADLLLIDDGWQVSKTAPSYAPEKGIGWKPHPDVYPHGWKNIVRLKDSLHLSLGLWAAAVSISLEEMLDNWQYLKNKQIKLDFAVLKNHDDLDKLMNKARQYMLATKLQSSISWDLTENAPRYGYYWAREYGNLHFMNRKPQAPASVVYVPWLCLRDFWHLSAYNNLNKYQLTIQNPEITNKAVSDAYQHSLEYCTALALMGIPQFFTLPRLFSKEGKAAVQKLLLIYNKERKNIWESYQFPVGEQPSNKSFSGFQSFHPNKKEGYFMFYRELHAPENRKELAIRFLQGKRLALTDLKTGRTWQQTVSSGGKLLVTIDKPAAYTFIKYRIVN